MDSLGRASTLKETEPALFNSFSTKDFPVKDAEGMNSLQRYALR